MSESRHVASIVLTCAEPAETDLIIQTLRNSDVLTVERAGSHYVDVEVVE
jgi:hypothetical protein